MTLNKPIFNIQTPHDFLHQLIIPQHNEFIQKNSSVRHALLTIILVYHMYEWVHSKKFTKIHFKTTYPSDLQIVDRLILAGNITNGTKHFIHKANTHMQTGFSSGFSDGFARPLNVEFPDGRKESVDIFLRELVEFWKRQQLF